NTGKKNKRSRAKGRQNLLRTLP
ncbi:hypothetical protein OXX59_006377, partial [Metschnikowia pulcherrima]